VSAYSCYRRRESAQRWRRKQRRGGQPSTSVAEYGWLADPVKAGLRPPPPAADGLDRACHPAFVCHQAFDRKERLKSTQMPCQLFSLRHLCADSDNRPHAAPLARLLQPAREIAPHPLDQLRLAVEELRNGCSGSRRTPCRINSRSAKLICRAAARATAQPFLRLAVLPRARFNALT
jgi:hypothetical protein